MGNHKRKRKSPPLNQEDGSSNPKSLKIADVPLFLNDLHGEPFRILSDLLTEKNLVFVEVRVHFEMSFNISNAIFRVQLGVERHHLFDG